MKFSIVTPSFRNSKWLKLCVASVADQEGVEVEHIVQDSCSDDGTQDWLSKDPRVKAFIEKDTGMYDDGIREHDVHVGISLKYLRNRFERARQILLVAIQIRDDFAARAPHPAVDRGAHA